MWSFRRICLWSQHMHKNLALYPAAVASLKSVPLVSCYASFPRSNVLFCWGGVSLFFSCNGNYSVGLDHVWALQRQRKLWKGACLWLELSKNWLDVRCLPAVTPFLSPVPQPLLAAQTWSQRDPKGEQFHLWYYAGISFFLCWGWLKPLVSFTFWHQYFM